ncbi:amino-acid transporter subunit; membrane component of ABC superfamily [Roseovarius sp. EC-HK134]|uniref:Putative glutamine ABC transporter permease protein GlnM n=1 Tax=Roseovarius mucosus TaxID=215743 RepID=A0A1V0RM98_9RHOB|nr:MULTISPECIES: ABC transporter permease subunit [Roseovarius]ARE82898.1 putative glutamine ABC transporter permease protein GlnM [Roseovarius mucosus]AWZ20467.1 Glutamate/glutamine/aspartate/asparagine transport system permease protein bztB [Roseovarius sp. AK1035]EDM31206.1 Amino acid ABC transporter, permease protein, 3-TM region, His/Glu/Gln/Arg/opine [Roseovarius sp. TM1035]MBW4975951.1 ABC transporter permease subunit [Roseovarius mucosus]VVT17017.1 amino-acid transporter subunit; membr|tara:strand:- start:2221 stop:3435 length:1215 start_codon:yes stop_codon:yes gene_type:complete
MTTMTDPPKASFQLSMLIYDTRYRSYTFQFIALVLLMLLLGYLGANLVNNLAAQGQNISFGFLSNPANYDINQRPIEYDSQSSHLRASLVGVINTLIVAFLGCATATIFGVTAGVLRLSPNWLVRKLMAFYVEIFRNIPVLIWILIIFTVMTAVLPSPNQFRGDNADASMLFDAFAFTNRGIYTPAPVWGPGSLVVVLTFLASIFGVFAYRRYATKLLYDTGRLLPMGWPSLVILFVPTILIYFVLGQPISLNYPALKGFNFDGGLHIRGSLIALWFALAIYTGAFIAENVRAGIQAVSKGQTEAAASLGLRPNRIMNLVILPQALRVIIPPLISQYLNLTKNSSLAIAVGYMDVTGTLGGITLNQTGRAIECVLMLMLFYLTISLAISAIMNVYNNSIKLKER